MAKKKGSRLLPKLTSPEQDLLLHLENGYQLETDSLGGNPVLRCLKDDDVIRPPSINRNTIEALQRRELIKSSKTREPLTTVWRLKKKTK